MNEGLILVGIKDVDQFLVYDSKTNLLVDNLKFGGKKVICSSSQTSNGCSKLLFQVDYYQWHAVLFRHHLNKKTVQIPVSIEKQKLLVINKLNELLKECKFNAIQINITNLTKPSIS